MPAERRHTAAGAAGLLDTRRGEPRLKPRQPPSLTFCDHKGETGSYIRGIAADLNRRTILTNGRVKVHSIPKVRPGRRVSGRARPGGCDGEIPLLASCQACLEGERRRTAQGFVFQGRAAVTA